MLCINPYSQIKQLINSVGKCAVMNSAPICSLLNVDFQTKENRTEIKFKVATLHTVSTAAAILSYRELSLQGKYLLRR